MQQQEPTGQHTKKQHGCSRSNKSVHFTWPALLADQTGDGENFMRRYLQMRCPAFVTVSKNARRIQKTGIKVQNESRSRGVTGHRSTGLNIRQANRLDRLLFGDNLDGLRSADPVQ